MRFGLYFVEDEIGIRARIRDSIDWADTDFDYLGDAPDGEEALPQILEKGPDIVVTDIRMPFMDGLELCRHLKAARPEIEIVLLSGHDDFEYARQAIRLGVSEYLLKPITPLKLLQALNRVAEKLGQSRAAGEEVARLQTQLESARPLLAERFLHTLITAPPQPADALRQAEGLGIDLREPARLVLVARSPGPMDAAALAKAVEQAGPVFPIGYYEAGVLISGPSEAEVVDAAARLAAVLSGSGWQVGAGQPVLHLGQLPQSYRDACLALDSRQDTGAPLGSLADVPLLDKEELLDFMRTGAVADIPAFLDRYLAEQDGQNPSLMYSLYTLSHFAFVAQDFVAQLGHGRESCPGVYRLIDTRQALGDLRGQYQALLHAAMACRDQNRDDRYGDVLGQVRQYVAQHYPEGEISLDSLASLVGLSAGHLSAIFKKETGATITEYVMDVRIKKAKELLRTTALRTAQISDAVGYGDANYFSTLFKRQTGFTPGEYRRR